MTSLNPSLRLALINKAKSKKTILQKGFTLIELLVTVVILGTLSAVAVPAYLEYSEQGKLASATADAIARAKECVNAQTTGTAIPNLDGSEGTSVPTCTGQTFESDVDINTEAQAQVQNGRIVITREPSLS